MVKRHAAERALKLAVVPDLEVGALLTQLRAALVQRITSLIVVSGRRRAIAIGTEAVSAALVRKRVPAVIVAGDAGEAARALAEAPGRGGPRVLRYADKAALGALFNRGEVALVALLDPSVAAEAVSTIDRLAALEES
jgi:ribosomal protein L7Ae-like RNA K-turn-binding protein